LPGAQVGKRRDMFSRSIHLHSIPYTKRATVIHNMSLWRWSTVVWAT